MTNVTKILDNLRCNDEVKTNLERAKGKYESKPFAIEYASTYKAIQRFGFIPSIFSAVGGCLAFVTLMPNIHIAIPLIVGGCLAGSYEVLKSWATALGFQAYFKHKSWLALLLVGLLYLGSVALSTWGAFNGYTLLESDKVGSAVDTHQSEVDSLNSYYEKLLKDEQTALSKFEKQHTVQGGKISWAVRNEHKAFVERLTAFKDEKKLRVQALKDEQPSIIQSAKSEMGGYLWLALGVALLIEVTIFCFRRFSEYYDFRSHSEVELLERGDVLSVDISSLQKLAQLVQGSNVVPQLVAGSPTGGRVVVTGLHGGSPSSEAKQPEQKGADCLNCGSAYTKSVSWQKYCSDSCREQYNNSKK